METIKSLLEIEILASQSDQTQDEFTFCLWKHLCKNKKAVKTYARTLNVFPTIGNVYEAIKEYFFKHITYSS